ncbi:MAG: DUF2330 domain-containing protein [Spirochaetes bacterium]|nr:DUF2330 domain-containing protein [Spirochaetota bacterium]
MKTRTLVSILILVLALFICVGLPLYADRGSIPFEANVKIFEPNQRAMIAWNGYEEILLLTTDLYASESTKVLEVIPLPSEPVVTEGDIEVFQKATYLINKKLAKSAKLSRSRSKGEKGGEAEKIEPAGEITFHEKIGAHDISVAHVLNSQGFIDWVDKYLKSAGVENPKIPKELKTVIAEYLEEGYGWFVFDVVQLDREPKTNEALQYRFITDFLYYPLKITRTEEGDTTIDLLILTPKIGYDYEFTGIPEDRIYFPHEPISLNNDELKYLNEEMYELFGYFKYINYTPYLQIWQITGKLSSFEEDLIVNDLYKDGLINYDELKKMVELFFAVEIGDTETVKVLLDAGADVNAKTNNDWTALMGATSHGYYEIIELLKKSGAKE